MYLAGVNMRNRHNSYSNPYAAAYGQQADNMKDTKQDVRQKCRMLSREEQNFGYSTYSNSYTDLIQNTSQSYADTMRMQREKAKNTSLKLKKLRYQFKNISTKILCSKTSEMARQAAGQARREVLRLKREKQNGNFDAEEINAALAHASAMERVAKKKVKHLEEEERAAISNGIFGGIKINGQAADEEKITGDAQAMEEVVSQEAEGAEEAEITYEAEVIDEGELLSDMLEEFADLMGELLNEMVQDELADFSFSISEDMSVEDLKAMKTAHRNKERRDIVKADSEYLKALFGHYEKMKNEGSAFGNGNASGVQSTGTQSISVSSGVAPACPVMETVIDISV